MYLITVNCEKTTPEIERDGGVAFYGFDFVIKDTPQEAEELIRARLKAKGLPLIELFTTKIAGLESGEPMSLETIGEIIDGGY